MKTKLLCLLTLLLTINLAKAQPPANVGVAPTLRVVHGVEEKKGLAYIRESLTRYVPIVKTIFVIENGQQVAKNVTETAAVIEESMIALEIANCRVIMPNGKQLPIDDVWKRLKSNTVIALSANSNTPSSVFLQALNAETLVVIPQQMVVVPQPKVVPKAK